MKLRVILLFLQLWGNVNVSLSWNGMSCDLHLTPLQGTTHHPQHKTQFLPGEMVQVSCGDKFWILNTRTTVADVICKDDGQWNIKPICQEVRCPISLQDEHLSHGFSTWIRNKLGDTVRYGCKLGYKRTDGVNHATCTRNGWTPKPLCQALSCELHLPPVLGTTYYPQNKILFLPGETVQVSCGEKFWILNNQTTVANVTCKDGEWNTRPICQEFRCPDDPPEEHMYDGVRAWWQNKLGDFVSYSCRKGYERSGGARYATCTRDGWTPKPFCQAKHPMNHGTLRN